MPRLTGSIAAIQFDLAAANAALNAELRSILHAGTKQWVRTVVGIVPTWSGASQSAIKPLADLVGEPVFNTPVSHVDSTGRLRAAPDRRAEGERLGQAELHDTGPVYYFRWNSAVLHFIFNEFNNANMYGFRLRNPGPYHSQRRASEAFFRTVNPRLRQLQFDFKTHFTVVRRVIGK